MKITMKHLKNVIKEEFENFIKEDVPDDAPDYKGYNVNDRISAYLFTVPNNSQGRADILKVKEALHKFYKFRLRGRHHDRKELLGAKYIPGTQNDVPLKQAEYIAVYVYPKS